MLPKEEGIKISLEPLLIDENRSQEISVKLTNSFNSDIENLSLRFSCPALKAGQYSLKIELTFSINGEKRKIEEERMLFVKAI